LDGRILLDIPPSAVLDMRRHGIAPEALDVVLVSHLHADHAFGLPFHLLDCILRSAGETPLAIVGPPGLRAHSEELFALAWPGLDVTKLTPKRRVEYVELQPRREVKVADIAVSAIPMSHFGLVAYGYRVTCQGVRLAYTGDTGDCGEIDELTNDVDALILELTHIAPTRDADHLDVATVARVAEKVRGRGGKVFATHMSVPPTHVPAGVTACEDGKTYWT